MPAPSTPRGWPCEGGWRACRTPHADDRASWPTLDDRAPTTARNRSSGSCRSSSRRCSQRCSPRRGADVCDPRQLGARGGAGSASAFGRTAGHTRPGVDGAAAGDGRRRARATVRFGRGGPSVGGGQRPHPRSSQRSSRLTIRTSRSSSGRTDERRVAFAGRDESLSPRSTTRTRTWTSA